jgi:hypothetical protein
MTSQLDFDQSGTARTWQRIYAGPSVGWILVAQAGVFPITAAGTYSLDPSLNEVTVNVAGSVIIFLPSVVVPLAGPQAQPNLVAQSPVSISDIGGHAQAFPIIIKPGINSQGITETIMGLTQISITANFGGFTLAPNSTLATWNSISP